VLLDTCILSELRKADGAATVKAFVTSLPAKSLFLSVITVGEIAKGVALLDDGRKKQALATWLLGLSRQFEDRILGIDQETAEVWGQLSATAQNRGDGIRVADGLIAATAQQHGLHVATRNIKHFEAAGVLFVNPWPAPDSAPTQ
jgi:predicted nucleic acid-binding protein